MEDEAHSPIKIRMFLFSTKKGNIWRKPIVADLWFPVYPRRGANFVSIMS